MPGRILAATRTTAGTRNLVTPHLILDQQNLTGGVGAGFGEASGQVYKGQGFIPTATTLSAIAFQLRATGSQGMKVFIDNADANFFPTGTLGVGLYSFTIANGSLATTLKTYNLPVALTIVPGNRYCFYLAPWNIGGNVYADDYRDMEVSVANPYANGKNINYSGSWVNGDGGNQDLVFQTYGTAERILAS